MQSLPTSSKHTAGRALAIGLTSKHAWGRVAALATALVLLTSAIKLYAPDRVANSSLVLRVSPEELLQVKDGSVVLKIRLGPGTIANVWAANSCTSPAPQSQVVTASGTYTFPLPTLMSGISDPNPSTTQVCLVSSDGTLNDSVPVGISAIGNGAAAEGRTPLLARNGVSVVVQDGWAVTTRAGTTTWSNP